MYKTTYGLNAMAISLSDYYKKKQRKVAKAECVEVINLLLKDLANSLIKGKKVRLERIGVLGVKNINSRTARNPKTGETFISIKKKGVKFKASKYLLTKINNPNVSLKRRKKKTSSNFTNLPLKEAKVFCN